VSARLVRLPLWVGIDDAQTDRVVEAVWQVTQVK
jgi:dTDP-4-amino-4,6-dideoxygalactose transaminase